MIITLLIVACVLLSVAVVILFTVLKKQRDEISALKLCALSFGEKFENVDFAITNIVDNIDGVCDDLDYIFEHCGIDEENDETT